MQRRSAGFQRRGADCRNWAPQRQNAAPRRRDLGNKFWQVPENQETQKQPKMRPNSVLLPIYLLKTYILREDSSWDSSWKHKETPNF